MKKSPYESYFGKNIPRIIFLIACGIMAFGAFNYAVGNPYGASIFFVVGGIMIFFTVHKQVTNKSIDEKVHSTEKEYAIKNFRNRAVGKRELAPAEFSTFSGYIWDNGGVRFKSCSDKKLRTSKYYVTALSVTQKECIVSTTVYNLLSDEETKERFIALGKNDSFSFQANETDFPKGNMECIITPLGDTDKIEFRFFLPKGDYLAEQFIEKISKFAKEHQ